MKKLKPRYRFDWACGHWRDSSFFHRYSCSECGFLQRRRLDIFSAPAHRAVAKAIEAGALPALDGSVPCRDCGARARIYDHRSYAKPLEVDAVCVRCNHRRGPAIEHAGIVRRPWSYRRAKVTLQ